MDAVTRTTAIDAHADRLRTAFGLDVHLHFDLAEHLRIIGVDHATPDLGRPPAVINPVLDPGWHPDASEADSLIVTVSHQGLDMASVGVRLVTMGGSLRDGIDSGEIFYGCRTPACGLRYNSAFGYQELAGKRIALFGGLWKRWQHDKAPRGLIAPLWRLLMAAFARHRWDFAIGLQHEWHSLTLGWPLLRFTDGAAGIAYEDDPEWFALMMMSRSNAETVAQLTADYAAPGGPS